MHVQKAEDEHHDGYEADERKHKKHDQSGSICVWQPMIAPPSLGLREHGEASCHSTADLIREVRSLVTASGGRWNYSMPKPSRRSSARPEGVLA
jgi:hypothetical protein